MKILGIYLKGAALVIDNLNDTIENCDLTDCNFTIRVPTFFHDNYIELAKGETLEVRIPCERHAVVRFSRLINCHSLVADGSEFNIIHQEFSENELPAIS